MGKCLGVALVSLFTSPVLAAIIVAPGGPEAGGSVNTPIRNSARTWQEYVDSSQLTSISETVQITGICFRLAAGVNGLGSATLSWPAVNLNYTQYNLQLSRGSATVQSAKKLGGVATNFINNLGTGITTVRSGGYTIPAGGYSNVLQGDGIKPWGPEITFTTPYIYSAGEELVLTLRHSGFGSGDVQALLATVARAVGTADSVGATGAAAIKPDSAPPPAAILFRYSPIPEPATVALGIVLTMGLHRLRR